MLLLLLPLSANAQRGVDLRNWEEAFQFTRTEIHGHLSLMKLNNVEAVWVDQVLAANKHWDEYCQQIGIELHTGNQRFGINWTSQCKPDGIRFPYDSTNCVEGMVTPDFQVTEALIRLKKDFQPIQFSWAGERLTVHKVSNRYQLKDLNYEWRLMADGKAIESGWFTIDEDSLRAKLIDLRLKTAIHTKQYHHLEVYAKARSEDGAIPKGHEVAKEQFELSVVKKRPLQVSTHTKMETADKKDRIELSGANFRYTIDRTTGLLSSMIVNGEEQLNGPLIPAFKWAGDDLSQYSEWVNLENEMSISDVILEAETPYLVKITTLLNLGERENALKIRYQIFSTGDIRYTQRLAISDTMIAIPRFGVMMNLSAQVDSMAWFGRGPHTCYQNASSSAFYGMFEKSSEYGGVRTDMKWADLSFETTDIFLAGEPEFACFIHQDGLNSIGIFSPEKAHQNLIAPKEVAGQEVKLRLRIRPIDPEKENAWKLSRYSVREMRPPLPKAMESRKHEVTK